MGAVWNRQHTRRSYGVNTTTTQGNVEETTLKKGGYCSPEPNPSPEYSTFRSCYPQIIEYVKQQCSPFCNQIFSKGYITEQVRDKAKLATQSSEVNANILVDALSDKIRSDPRAFSGFLEIIKADDLVSSKLVNLVQETYDSESNVVQVQPPIVQDLVPAGVKYIEYASLTVKDDLGSGNFSDVYIAEWVQEGRPVRRVAVKVPKSKVKNAEIVKQDVKQEIEAMSKLNHPSIVALVGISEVTHNIGCIGVLPIMILEFINGGTLRANLNKHQEKELGRVRLRQFISFSIHIANAMQYLEKKKIVHRDLAARNVLLVRGTDLIKISDFGLARNSTRNTSDYAYYCVNYQELPIYWYAPEGLRHLRFTSKGDVWSFGVTLWEMFSNGKRPDRELKTVDVIHDLPIDADQALLKESFNRLANRLEQADDHLPRMDCCPCSGEIHDIMRGCWEVVPSKRSSFKKLSQQLTQLLKKC